MTAGVERWTPLPVATRGLAGCRALAALISLMVVAACAAGDDSSNAATEPVGSTEKSLTAGELAKLYAGDAAIDDLFGSSVAISGDTAVVGAPGSSSGTGAAYVFYRNQGGPNGWGEVTTLTASNAAAGAEFGAAVAIDGDEIVVGAHREDSPSNLAGAAYVFSRNQDGPDAWGELAKLTATDAEANDRFGQAVATSDGVAIVGARQEDTGGVESGAAYVFARDEGGPSAWDQVEKLKASDTSDNAWFGASVAVSGEVAVVGANFESSAATFAGAAYVFHRNQGGADHWGEIKKLGALDASSADEFGYAVAVDGDVLIVGARLAPDSINADTGAGYVFYRHEGGNDNWGQMEKITGAGTVGADEFGSVVALAGDLALIGSPRATNQTAYGFLRDLGGGHNWGQALTVVRHGGFASAISTTATTAIVGAPTDGTAGANAGAAYIFTLERVLGEPCELAETCRSGFCVDGVCCDTECGAGLTGDCLACSQQAGAAVDGTCTSRADGELCDDGTFCNGTESCTSGTCGGSSGDPCFGADGDDNCAETCDESTDHCAAADPDGSTCNDGTLCTGGDACQAGICSGQPTVVCDEPTECQQSGTCDFLTGLCIYAPKPDGTPCSGGACRNGICGPPVGSGGDGDAEDDGGCGCRLAATHRQTPAGASLALLVLGLGLVWRRRRFCPVVTKR